MGAGCGLHQPLPPRRALNVHAQPDDLIRLGRREPFGSLETFLGARGSLAEGGERLNLREVAERAGVAMSSVSRVLSDHPDVSPKMRERVLAVVDELGYEPDLLAQSLRRGSTMSVGFMVRDISSPLFSEIVLGAETELRGQGYSMLLTNSEGLPELDAAYIRLFRRRRVDGLLLSLTDEWNSETLQELDRLQMPYVLIDREIVSLPDASAVLCDHAGGLREATEHLIELGHRRLGIVGSPLNTRPGREVLRGFKMACAEHGVEALVEIGPFTREHGAAAAQRLLDLPEPPTALVSGSNQILPGVLEVLRSRNLRIPDDVSLVTFDEVRLLEFIEPPIAVVSREPLEIGREAAALLLRLLQGGESERVYVPTRFIARESCAAPGGRHR
jgi:LacI family transcriptional regulator